MNKWKMLFIKWTKIPQRQYTVTQSGQRRRYAYDMQMDTAGCVTWGFGCTVSNTSMTKGNKQDEWEEFISIISSAIYVQI